MIEKRVGYQDGRGVHDPLETIVFLMSKRSSPGGLSSDEEKELNRLIEKTGYMSQKKSRGGRIGYNGGGKPNGEKPGDSSGFDPLYGGSGENILIFPRDKIKPWWQDDDETKRGEGIMSQVAQRSTKDLREFYGGYLVPYGYKEWEIMTMPMKELEYLFNTVMNI